MGSLGATPVLAKAEPVSYVQSDVAFLRTEAVGTILLRWLKSAE